LLPLLSLHFPTLIVASVLACILMAGAYLIVWTRNRREISILWMVASTTLACAGAVTRETIPEAPAIFVTDVLLFLSFGCIGVAARKLTKRKASILFLVVPPCLWIAACTQPILFDDRDLRSVLAAAFVAAQMAWVFSELCRDQSDRLVSRYWLMALMAINGLGATARAIGIWLIRDIPHPGLPLGANIAAATLWTSGFLLLSGFGFIALVHERSERRLKHAAHKDDLTGLGNRGQFDIAFDVSFQRAQHVQEPLALLMVDVDRFKAYNDTHGHLAGDDCLRTIANTLQSTFINHGGLVYRYGGEEFAILMPATYAASAAHHAEVARLAVMDLALAHPDYEGGVATISIGVAATIPSFGATAHDLLSKADRNLYAAKRHGRNRVSVSVEIVELVETTSSSELLHERA
jgi:diguanylate cyclase (GGDEF)-like protein